MEPKKVDISPITEHKIDPTITELIYYYIGTATIQLKLELIRCLTIRELVINNYFSPPPPPTHISDQ